VAVGGVSRTVCHHWSASLAGWGPGVDASLQAAVVVGGTEASSHRLALGKTLRAIAAVLGPTHYSVSRGRWEKPCAGYRTAQSGTAGHRAWLDLGCEVGRARRDGSTIHHGYQTPETEKLLKVVEHFPRGGAGSQPAARKIWRQISS